MTSLKRILEINSSTVGSTGKIMFMIAEKARDCGYEVYTASAKHRNEKKIDRNDHIYIGGIVGKKLSLFLSKNTGYNGCFSILATWRFLRRVDRLKPELIHFHNLHNSYINLKMLFRYVKRHNVPIVWTLHDCWSFTGHCPYFDFIGCNKWKTGCGDCPQLSRYPFSKKDRSREMYENKRNWFTGCNMTIVTPSDWLGGIVKESFLKDYEVVTINNGINLDVFKPRTSDFRENYGLGGKFIILGVANSWEPRKGLDVFIELRRRLDSSFSIVVIGVNEHQKRELPEGIIAISRTENQQQLAEIYSAADVFVNPTREENFPTTNLEALACGTGVITFRTGGSPEMLDESCGIVLEKEDIDGIEQNVRRLRQSPFDRTLCRNKALHYGMNESYVKYIKLYANLLKPF